MIYENFELLPEDLQGWNGDRAIFGKLIEELRPDLIIEVGSWKGMSSINMAGHLRRLGLSSKIYCIDTWLGSLDFWLYNIDFLNLKNGYPRVYEQFLSNVVHRGFQDLIEPLPMTSRTGARYLSGKGVQSSLIYIDASHEEEDVYSDLTDYIKLLRPGGVMFGDDWRYYGVRPAVERFSKERSLDLEIEEDHFWKIKH